MVFTRHILLIVITCRFYVNIGLAETLAPWFGVSRGWLPYEPTPALTPYRLEFARMARERAEPLHEVAERRPPVRHVAGG